MKLWGKIKGILQSELELFKEGLKQELREQKGTAAFLIVAAPW